MLLFPGLPLRSHIIMVWRLHKRMNELRKVAPMGFAI